MDTCIFCKIVRKKTPAYIIYEDKLTMAFLDKYPQSRGHLQLIPKKHCLYVYEIPQMGEFFTIAQKIIRVIIPVLNAEYVTLATFGMQVRHAHLWIVPQYRQEVRVTEGAYGISDPQALKQIGELLRNKLLGGGVV